MSMAKKVKMLEQEREQWQAELRAVMGRERAQIEAARAADKARIAALEAEKERGFIPDGVWRDGCPPSPYCSEWFIAKLDNGQRVVLKELHQDHSYDYRTADETYYSAFRIAAWMQFQDSEYIAPAPAPAERVEQNDWPKCDYCGEVPDCHPWHGSGMFNGVDSPHIHACTDCRHLLPTADERVEQGPVAEVIPNAVGIEMAWIDPWNKPPVGTNLYAAPPAPAAPEPVAYVQHLPPLEHQPLKPYKDSRNGYVIPLYTAPAAPDVAGLLNRIVPRIDAGGPNPIDPALHCCEWTLHKERDRIHNEFSDALATFHRES